MDTGALVFENLFYYKLYRDYNFFTISCIGTLSPYSCKGTYSMDTRALVFDNFRGT
jgi:hypothetical protein